MVEGMWSASRDFSESLLGLTASWSSISEGLSAWSGLKIDTLKQIAASIEVLDPSTTMNWGMGPVKTADVSVLEPQMQMALRESLERISGFGKLDPDWDSYGGKNPTTEALSAASQYLQTLVSEFWPSVGNRALPFWVSPLPNGGIQLEWREPKSELEVEVGPEGKTELLAADGPWPRC